MAAFANIEFSRLYKSVISSGEDKLVTSHHELSANSYGPSQSSDRSFGLIVGAILVGLSAHSFWRDGSLWPYYAIAGGALLLAAWSRPGLLGPLNRFWTQLGLAIGTIVHPIILGALFFLVFTPIALIARFVGKHFLDLRRDHSAPTYWVSRNSHAPNLDNMREQF